MDKLKPIQRRGGMRKNIKRRPTSSQLKNNPKVLFKDSKSTALGGKRIVSYRFLFFTDFSVDDVAMLTMFFSWVNTNIVALEDRNVMPFYGFVTNNTKLAKDFITSVGEFLGWSDKEGTLYKQYHTLLNNRVWSKEKFNIDTISKVKPQNLIAVYMSKDTNWLKEENLTTSCLDNIISVGHYPGSSKTLHLKVETQRTYLTLEDNPKVFKEINECEDGEPSNLLKEALTSYNLGDLSNRLKEKNFETEDELDAYDLDSVLKEKAALCVKNNMYVLDVERMLMFIAILVKVKTFKDHPFELVPMGGKDENVVHLRIIKGKEKVAVSFIENLLYNSVKEIN